MSIVRVNEVSGKSTVTMSTAQHRLSWQCDRRSLGRMELTQLFTPAADLLFQLLLLLLQLLVASLQLLERGFDLLQLIVQPCAIHPQ